jgi:hypothetical protein
MKSYTILVVGLAIAVFTLAVDRPVIAQDSLKVSTVDVGSDSNPIGPPVVVIPEKYQPSYDKVGGATATVTGTAVYFTPQDENTSATVLFLYNTNDITKTVGLQTFYTNGSLTLDTTVLVPANGMVRICSDTVSTVSASWADYVLVNFTTFSAWAKLTLPKGVKAEGYVVYNPSGVYDPLTEAQMLPLRFSVKKNTVP